VAGFVLSNSGRRYVLVAIVIHANVSRDDVRVALDELVRWTARDLEQEWR